MEISPAPYIRVSPAARHAYSPPPQPTLTAASAASLPASPMAGPESGSSPAAPPPRESAASTNDSPWLFNNNPNWQGFRHDLAVPSRTQSYPGPADAPQELDPVRRPSPARTITPDPPRDLDKPDDDTTPRSASDARLQSERQLGQRTLRNSSQAYDRGLLSKIGGPNAPLRLSSISSNPGESLNLSPIHADPRASGAKRLSVPEDRLPSMDMQFASRTNSTASAYSQQPSFRSSSIFEAPENRGRHNGQRHPSIAFDHRPSIAESTTSYSAEEGQLRDLNIGSPRGSIYDTDAARAGMKRRASSPHADHMRYDRSFSNSTVSTQAPYMRGSTMIAFAPLGSPNSRCDNNPRYSSMSSVSSMGVRTASLTSSHKLSIASSTTSYGSRLSPALLSPAAIETDSCGPYGMSRSLNPSPRASLSALPVARHSIDLVGHMTSPLNTRPGASGLLICDCCPKKPKKFNTEEDLRLHHMEKQYTCRYCTNRFKNKNEAERHQNSLHLRRHSWSCAALQSVDQAFHPSQSTNGATEACGYCGAEFAADPPNWDERRRHLSAVHKFGECNQGKKFFRADHFRQHLKHSHAGTSGKWTNLLENACMRDEPMDPPLRPGPGGQELPPLLMYTHVQSPTGPGPGPRLGAPFEPGDGREME